MPKKDPVVDPRIAHIAFRCTSCGRDVGRAGLTKKRVQWQTMDEVVVRSRVRGWLCDACRDTDPDYLAEPLTASPGMAGAGHGRAARKKARDAAG